MEENGLSYNIFYLNPLSYHLVKSGIDHTADILLCNAVELNNGSERVGKFSNLFVESGGYGSAFYLQRHLKIYARQF